MSNDIEISSVLLALARLRPGAGYNSCCHNSTDLYYYGNVPKPTARDPEKLLPLSPLHFHILIALTEGERHGYAIKKSVIDSSSGTIQPGAGSLYNAIKGLLAESLIEETGERPDPHLDDERRRYYRITPFGHQVARAEVERLGALLRWTRKLPGFASD